MTAHEPINYLDSVLNEEETRCEYSHQWRNFTISRSGRFKSKNKKRAEVADGKLFDDSTHKAKEDEKMKSYKEQQDKNSARSYQHHSTTSSNGSQFKQHPSMMTTTSSSPSANTRGNRSERTAGTYKSYYETNL